MSSEEYKKRNVTLIDNDPNEIKSLVAEMLDLINSKYSFETKLDENQKKCNKIFDEYINLYGQKKRFGKTKSRFSSHFLKSNLNWLE